MELSNINVYENMVVNIHTIHKLMEYKKWGDALLLWFRYYEQRNIQWQQNTFSTDEFMIKWMWWSKDRFIVAKKILKECGMIDIINVRDNKTHQSIWWFVKVNYTFNPQSVRTHNIIMEVSKSSLDHQNPEIPDWGKPGSKIQPNYNINNYRQPEIPFTESRDNNKNSLNSESRAGELDVCARVQTYADIQEVIEDDSYRVNNNKLLKCVVKMCELWYQVDKKEKPIKELVNRIKEKAEIYNIKNADWSVAQWTMLQIFDQWLEYYNGNGKNVSNHKTSVMRFMINHNKPYKKSFKS